MKLPTNWNKQEKPSHQFTSSTNSGVKSLKLNKRSRKSGKGNTRSCSKLGRRKKPNMSPKKTVWWYHGPYHWQQKTSGTQLKVLLNFNERKTDKGFSSLKKRYNCFSHVRNGSLDLISHMNMTISCCILSLEQLPGALWLPKKH